MHKSFSISSDAHAGREMSEAEGRGGKAGSTGRRRRVSKTTGRASDPENVMHERRFLGRSSTHPGSKAAVAVMTLWFGGCSWQGRSGVIGGTVVR